MSGATGRPLLLALISRSRCWGPLSPPRCAARSWASAGGEPSNRSRNLWPSQAGEGAPLRVREPSRGSGSGTGARGGVGRLLEPRTSAGRARASLVSPGDAQDPARQEPLAWDVDGSLSGAISGGGAKAGLDAVGAAHTKGGGVGAMGLPGRTRLPPHLVFLREEDLK